MSELINNNQGYIAIIGIILVIPFYLIADKLIQGFSKRKHRQELQKRLLRELWINMNYVAQIERSYQHQIRDLENLHLPHYPPRTTVIEKFLELEVLFSINETERERILETFTLLTDLKKEFYMWKKFLLQMNEIDVSAYQIISSTVISYVDPLMKNMLDIWIQLVKKLGKKSNIEQIKEINQIILSAIRNGKWIRTSYKASFYNKDKYKEANKFDVILCWENDWTECEKEVIEVRNILSIFDSWKYN